MRTNRIFMGLVFSSVLVVSASGQRTAQLSEDLKALVPANAFGFAVVSSIDGAQDRVDAVVGRVDPAMADGVKVMDWLGQLLPDAALNQIDTGRPVGVAAVMGQAEPVPTMIFPLKDGAAFQEAMGEGVSIRGNYGAMTLGPPQAAPEGKSPLVENVPSADLVMRVDLARLIEMFRPMIEGAIDQGLESEPELEMLADLASGVAETLFDSAERLDFTLDVDGTSIDAEFILVAKDGSPLAKRSGSRPQLARLAGMAPGDHPISVLVSADWKQLGNLFMPFYESLAEALGQEEGGDAMLEIFNKSMDAYRYLGDDVMFTMGFGPNGIEMIGAASSSNPAGYIEASTQLWENDFMKAMGMKVTKGETAEIAGVSISSARMHFDFNKLLQGEDLGPAADVMDDIMSSVFGKDGWPIRMGGTQGLLLMSMGGTDQMMADLVARAVKPRTPEAALRRVVERAGGSPSFVMKLELRKFIGQILDLVGPMVGEDVPEMPEGDPVNISMYTARKGRSHHVGVLFDLGAIMDLVEALRDY